MAGHVIENPIINSPYEEPHHHHELDERGNPTGHVLVGRRRSTYLTPIPQPRRQSKQQRGLFEEQLERAEENANINNMRQWVSRWRTLGYPGATRISRQLLEYWRRPDRVNRLFFCQIEALETAIFITEAARREKGVQLDWLQQASEEANPGLYRTAFKMATGSGKTVVMAMLIAWQVLNRLANTTDQRFADAFLIVTPGVTIRDRLRVLLPADADNYYRKRDLVPPTLFEQLHRARIVITNYHAFMPREVIDASALTKKMLASGGDSPFTETPGQMVRRVCRGLGDARSVVILNDEAHHCYARRQEDNDAGLSREEKKELEERRVWVNGIREVAQKFKVRAIYDLSATPFFLAGSGYPEGQLFPWVVSDFALIDAIESGIVKIPRLPVADDTPEGDDPVYRSLWPRIRDSLPKRVTVLPGQTIDLPKELEGALVSLYGGYAETHAQWQREQAELDARGAGQSLPPPVMIVVCNNTTVSRRVYEWISGYERTVDTRTVITAGRLELFRNEEGGLWKPRPTTILVDSQQLENGEAMSDDFKKAAAREIDTFKAEYRLRYPDRDPDALTDQDLLREVMNTVGKPGRLGEGVKCVVSVSMLTEGWDVNAVTHILGVRAFSTQLICEQVIGRALRRISYEPDADGRFAPEYADVYGVPFSFLPTAGARGVHRMPRPTVHVCAMPEREADTGFRFPNVIGYRHEWRDQPLRASFSADSVMTLSNEQIPTMTESAPLIGLSEVHTMEELFRVREQRVVYELAQHVLERYFHDDGGAPQVWRFPQLLSLVREWMAGCVRLGDGCRPQLLLLSEHKHVAAEKIYRAIVSSSAEERLRLILDPDAPEGTSADIDFETVRDTWKTRPDRCHLNYIALDSGWEGQMAFALENMPEVLAYVKNEHSAGLRIPYTHEGNERMYVPDFLVRVRPAPDAEPLTLIVEVTGKRYEAKQAKADTVRRMWLPGVNALESFGQWEFIEIEDMKDAVTSIRRQLNQMMMTENR